MAQEPEKWDYKASGVPSPLTEDMEESSQEKKVARILWSNPRGVS